MHHLLRPAHKREEIALFHTTLDREDSYISRSPTALTPWKLRPSIIISGYYGGGGIITIPIQRLQHLTTSYNGPSFLPVLRTKTKKQLNGFFGYRTLSNSVCLLKPPGRDFVSNRQPQKMYMSAPKPRTEKRKPETRNAIIEGHRWVQREQNVPEKK